MERGLSDRLLTAVQQLEGGTATSLPYSTNLTARTPTVRTDEQGRIVNTGQAVAGALEGAYTAAEDLVMQVLNMGPARIRQGPPVGFTAGPMDQQVRDDYTLDDKARDALRILGELGNMTRFGDQTPYETPYPEATASERFIAGAATPDGGDVGRLIEGAIPFLRLTRRSAPEAADIINRGARNAIGLNPTDNFKYMMDELSSVYSPTSDSPYRVKVDRNAFDNNDFDFNFSVTDTRTGTEMEVEALVLRGQPALYIKSLRSPQAQSQGIGTGANLSSGVMNMVLEMADASGLSVRTLPSPMDNQIISERGLRTMYNRLGFQRENNSLEMVRRPMPIEDEARSIDYAVRMDPVFNPSRMSSEAQEMRELFFNRARGLPDLMVSNQGLSTFADWFSREGVPSLSELTQREIDQLIHLSKKIDEGIFEPDEAFGVAQQMFYRHHPELNPDPVLRQAQQETLDAERRKAEDYISRGLERMRLVTELAPAQRWSDLDPSWRVGAENFSFMQSHLPPVRLGRRVAQGIINDLRRFGVTTFDRLSPKGQEQVLEHIANSTRSPDYPPHDISDEDTRRYFRNIISDYEMREVYPNQRPGWSNADDD